MSLPFPLGLPTIPRTAAGGPVLTAQLMGLISTFGSPRLNNLQAGKRVITSTDFRHAETCLIPISQHILGIQNRRNRGLPFFHFMFFPFFPKTCVTLRRTTSGQTHRSKHRHGPTDHRRSPRLGDHRGARRASMRMRSEGSGFEEPGESDHVVGEPRRLKKKNKDCTICLLMGMRLQLSLIHLDS